MMEDILYTPEELSKKLKLSKYTIYELIKRGDLPAHHIGRSIRISQEQLETYFIKTKKDENSYEGEIFNEEGLTYVLINNFKIYISTTVTGLIKVSIPPEAIILSKENFKSSARNKLKGKVTDIIFEEEKAKVLLDLPMTAFITRRSLEEMQIKKGESLYAIFKALSVKIIKG